MADTGNLQSLISDGHRALQGQLAQDEDYNTAAKQYAELVAAVVTECGADKILDYGAGTGCLAENIGKYLSNSVEIIEYDPGIDGKDTEPEPQRFVACLDVLPFVESNSLSAVLDDLVRVSERILFLSIPTVKRAIFAEDGSSAYQIVEGMEWWLPRIMEKFDIYSMAQSPTGFWLVAKRKAE